MFDAREQIRAGNPSGGDTANRSYKESIKGPRGRTGIQPSLESKTVCDSKGSRGGLFDEVFCSGFERNESQCHFTPRGTDRIAVLLLN